MKTFNFETANKVMNAAAETLKGVRTDLRNGNKEYTSLSRVLKDITSAEMLEAGYAAVFAALNLDPKTVTPKDFLGSLADEMWGEDKKGEKYVGIWGLATKKDKDGNKVLKADGTPEQVAVLRKVTAWTPGRLFKVYSQSLAAKEATKK